MPDAKGSLYLFEAIELRSEYDRQIKLLEEVLGEEGRKSDSFLRSREEDIKAPSKDFHPKEIEEELKKIQTKRVKLNQAIQEANFYLRIKFNGEEITITEALEVRKNLNDELKTAMDKVKSSAYKTIIHKEERDIVREPKHSFTETYGEFKKKLLNLREVENMIHIANHNNTVKFRED